MVIFIIIGMNGLLKIKAKKSTHFKNLLQNLRRNHCLVWCCGSVEVNCQGHSPFRKGNEVHDYPFRLKCDVLFTVNIVFYDQTYQMKHFIFNWFWTFILHGKYWINLQTQIFIHNWKPNFNKCIFSILVFPFLYTGIH